MPEAEPGATAAGTGGLQREREQHQKQKRAKNMRTLTVMTTFMAFGEQMVRQTVEQMWLHAFDGNTAAYALVRGRLESATALISFLVTPVVAGLSDAIGRRLLMILSSLAIVGANALPLLAPAHGGGATLLLLGCRQMLYRIAQDLGQLVRQSSLGDMYAGDMVALAEATALDQALFPACKIVAPLIGGALALRSGLRVPFVLSSASMAVHGLVSFFVREALPAAERAPMRWRHSSLFAFLELFCRGRTMSILGLMTMLAWVGETGGQPTPAEQVCNLHKAKILGARQTIPVLSARV